MAIKIIPEQKIFICDVCQNENPIRAKHAVLTMKRDGLDFQGHAVADRSISFELCDDCETLITQAIDDEITRIREK